MPVKFVEEEKVIQSKTACLRTQVCTSEVTLSEYKISSSDGLDYGTSSTKKKRPVCSGTKLHTVDVWLCQV
jgi:hypothetical protein